MESRSIYPVAGQDMLSKAILGKKKNKVPVPLPLDIGMVASPKENSRARKERKTGACTAVSAEHD